MTAAQILAAANLVKDVHPATIVTFTSFERGVILQIGRFDNRGPRHIIARNGVVTVDEDDGAIHTRQSRQSP